MNASLRLLRPKHWIKNALILAPLFFAWEFDVTTLWKAAAAFAAFSFAASTVYVFNDLADAESDRHHPEKKKRPIASGEVSPAKARAIGAGVFLVAFLLCLPLPVGFGITLLGYFLMNLAYSFWLKRKLILDVMILAAGFVLRVVAGGFAFGIALSPWIVVCTFFASLFVGFGKRKNETDVLATGSTKHRAVLEHYTRDFLNQLLGLSAALTIMGYSLYTIDAQTAAHFGTGNLVYTVPFVVFGVFRYFHLMYNLASGGDPTQIFLRDKPTIANFFAWMAAFLLITHVSF